MPMKPAARLLALTLVFLLTLAAPALAERCVLCDAECRGSTYLCANCLLDLLAEKDVSGGLEITGVTANADGSVTLAWADSAENGPYSVYYELLESAPVSFGWTAAEGVMLPTVTLTQLAPGVSYVFTVADVAGHQAQYVYYAPTVEDGNDIGAKIRIHTRIHNGEQYLEYPFSASEIEQDNGKTHGLYVKMAYSMLKQDRNYTFCLTVEAPNGFQDVIYSGMLTLNRGKSEVPAWGFVELDEYFSYLERYYGGVPTGEYRVTMHFDGKHVYTVTFDVAE